MDKLLPAVFYEQIAKGFYIKKNLFTEKKKKFSLFINQRLMRIICSSEDGCGNFNVEST